MGQGWGGPPPGSGVTLPAGTGLGKAPELAQISSPASDVSLGPQGGTRRWGGCRQRRGWTWGGVGEVGQGEMNEMQLDRMR